MFYFFRAARLRENSVRKGGAVVRGREAEVRFLAAGGTRGRLKRGWKTLADGAWLNSLHTRLFWSECLLEMNLCGREKSLLFC